MNFIQIYIQQANMFEIWLQTNFFFALKDEAVVIWFSFFFCI